MRPGRRGFYRLTVGSFSGTDANKQPTRSLAPARLRIEFNDGDLRASMSLFGGGNTNGLLMNKDFKPGVGMMIVGTPALFGGSLVMTETELIDEWGFVRADYKGIPGQVSAASIAATMRSIPLKMPVYDAAGARLVSAMRTTPDALLGYMRRFVPVTSLAGFLRMLHAPATPEQGCEALSLARRLCVFQIKKDALAINQVRNEGRGIEMREEVLAALIALQPETLTVDQVRAVNAITNALRSPKPARLLIEGDVGSGKTLTFLLPAAAAASAGANIAILAPTGTLARQLHTQWQRRFPEVPSSLIIAGSKPVGTSVIIGTTAINSWAERNAWIPDVLIIDEQHKFSVDQRRAIAGPATHLIEASATPIPRSLALSIFAGMSRVTLRTPPVTRVIRSHLFDNDAIGEVSSMIRATLSDNRKVVLLYPAVSSGPRSVVEGAKRLTPLFGEKMVIVHGKMKESERTVALMRFSSGQSPILCASTVIEVGVDIQGIAMLVVVSADRFGAAQLHQLRGRVARDGGSADFVMMVDQIDKLDPDTLARLESVRNTLDGHALAERDLELRGFGDVAGEMQSGITQTIFKSIRLAPGDFLS